MEGREDYLFPESLFPGVSMHYHYPANFCFLLYCFVSQIVMFLEHIKVLSFCTHNGLYRCFSRVVGYNNNVNVLVALELYSSSAPPKTELAQQHKLQIPFCSFSSDKEQWSKTIPSGGCVFCVLDVLGCCNLPRSNAAIFL